MKRILLSSIITVLLLPTLAVAAPTVKVTSDANDGSGSLRAALTSGATEIVITGSVKTITVTEPLVYTGTAALKITGSGQTIDGSGLTDNLSPIFHVTQGADLTVYNLAFDGGGGYSRENQGGGKGIYVDVPDSRTGVIRIALTNVTVSGTGNHGIHVSDCSLGDDCGGGGGGAGDGSPASIDIRLTDVLIDGAGFGKADADGIRVDDRNDGDIVFSASNSTFVNVGADGVELDEGNNGNVYIDVRNTTFERNGDYCNGGDFDPNNEEDPCNDDGERDVDDGFDVDEAGPGSINGIIRNANVNYNFDEGLDFDEEDEGGVDIELINVFAEGNEDEGIKVSEQSDGDLVVTLRAAITQNNNGSREGIELEEKDDGDVDVSVTGSTINEPLKATEDGTGTGTIEIRGSSIESLKLENVTEI